LVDLVAKLVYFSVAENLFAPKMSQNELFIFYMFDNQHFTNVKMKSECGRFPWFIQ